MANVVENTTWFYQNQAELVAKYNGKFIAICDRNVLGAFDTFGSGVHAMIDAGHRPGTFIVHHCLPPEEERKAYYFRSNRVDFGRALAW